MESLARVERKLAGDGMFGRREAFSRGMREGRGPSRTRSKGREGRVSVGAGGKEAGGRVGSGGEHW